MVTSLDVINKDQGDYPSSDCRDRHTMCRRVSPVALRKMYDAREIGKKLNLIRTDSSINWQVPDFSEYL